MERSGWRQNYGKHEILCKCDHPRVVHYTQDGSCIYENKSGKCQCKAYQPKGRLEFQNKRSKCDYGHSHDSGLEIKVCGELHLQKLAGDITDFTFHELVDLLGPSGSIVARFESDFKAIYPDGTIEWIEAKGTHLQRDMGFRLKWLLLQDRFKGDRKVKFRMVIG